MSEWYDGPGSKRTGLLWDDPSELWALDRMVAQFQAEGHNTNRSKELREALKLKPEYREALHKVRAERRENDKHTIKEDLSRDITTSK